MDPHELHLLNLHDEEVGVRYRIEGYYLPLLAEGRSDRNRDGGPMLVLDCGCGNGLSVALLEQAGIDAFGIDSSPMRAEQWKGRGQAGARSRCLQADAGDLPFEDASFDVILSSGVLEHIGVDERCEPRYQVGPKASQAEDRLRVFGELFRVLRPGGVMYVDHPNGAFPVDFWHNDSAHSGKPRLHSPREGFAPTAREVRELARSVDPGCTVTPLSPAGRFTFRRTRRRRFRRLLVPALETWWKVLRHPPFSRLAGSALNPYLVVKIVRS